MEFTIIIPHSLLVIAHAGKQENKEAKQERRKVWKGTKEYWMIRGIRHESGSE